MNSNSPTSVEACVFGEYSLADQVELTNDSLEILLSNMLYKLRPDLVVDVASEISCLADHLSKVGHTAACKQRFASSRALAMLFRIAAT